jgi:HEAT repeat protein
MVTLGFHESIRSITYTATLTLFSLVLLFFLFSLIYQLFRALILGFRTRSRRKALHELTGYMLGESELGQVSERCRNRNSLIDGCATLISAIKGQKQERMKQAVGDLGLESVLHRWLHDTLPSRRMRACYFLGLMQSKSSTGELSKTLSDRNPAVVSAALIALGEVGKLQTLPDIVALFNRCGYAHAWLIAALLPIFGSAIYGHIRPSLLSDTVLTEKKVLMLKVMANLPVGESFRDLRDIYMSSSDLDIRVNALRAIGSINDLSAVKLVFDALTDDAWEIRAVACNAVGNMSLKGAAYRLIPLLKDNHFYVRKNAAQALLGLGQLGIMALVNYLEIDDVYARDAIVQALEEHGIVDRALNDADCLDEERRSQSQKILTAIVEKGYTLYLSNFTDSHPLVKKILYKHGDKPAHG